MKGRQNNESFGHSATILGPNISSYISSSAHSQWNPKIKKTSEIGVTFIHI